MAVSTKVAALTQNYLAKELNDTVLGANVGFTRFVSAAKKFRGAQVEFPFKHAKNTEGGSFSGYDVLSTTATDTRLKLTYDPKFVQKPVVLARTEISKNRTEEKVLDLIEVEMASSAQDLADDLGTMFYADGTGNSSKDLLGLGALIDDGNNVANIGGQPRATYSGLQSTVTASGGTMTLAQWDSLWDAVTSGQNKPTVILTTEAVFSFYSQLVQPQERIVKNVSLSKAGIEGETGFVGMAYRGAPVLADEKCTTGYLYFVNEKTIDFLAINYDGAEPVNFKMTDIKGNDYSSVKGLGFGWTGFVRPANQESLIGRIIFSGEFITRNPRHNGVLTGITGV